jgi:hypothetical protein
MFETLALPEKEALCPMIAKASSELEPKDLSIFLDALKDSRWTAPLLASEITRRGFKVSQNQIWKHRSKACACVQ